MNEHTQMTYPDFKEYMEVSFARRYPRARDISTHTVQKNNGVTLDGLTILQEDTNTSPTFYLNDLYADYLKGRTLEDITDSIAASYEKNKSHRVQSLQDFSEFDKIKERIVFRLISRRENATLLSEVPFIPYLDLALVFCMLVELENGCRGTILLRQDHLRCWGVAVDTIFDCAKGNTARLLLPDCTPIENVIATMLSNEDRDVFGDLTPAFPMYILTNQERLHGAAVICYPHLLEDISRRVGGSFYILPSSIHEVVIVPDNDNITMEELTEMVQDVNATQVAREEVLSDHAYFYDIKKACVCY